MNDWHLAQGYRYAGIVSGLRNEPNRRDIAVIVSDTPAAAAGVFTQNQGTRTPVQVSRDPPRPKCPRDIVCSGNANACTGQQGLPMPAGWPNWSQSNSDVRRIRFGRLHRRDRPPVADAGPGSGHPEGDLREAGSRP